jgi:hypothetical protein
MIKPGIKLPHPLDMIKPGIKIPPSPYITTLD